MLAALNLGQALQVKIQEQSRGDNDGISTGHNLETTVHWDSGCICLMWMVWTSRTQMLQPSTTNQWRADNFTWDMVLVSVMEHVACKFSMDTYGEHLVWLFLHVSQQIFSISVYIECYSDNHKHVETHFFSFPVLTHHTRAPESVDLKWQPKGDHCEPQYLHSLLTICQA